MTGSKDNRRRPITKRPEINIWHERIGKRWTVYAEATIGGDNVVTSGEASTFREAKAEALENLREKQSEALRRTQLKLRQGAE